MGRPRFSSPGVIGSTLTTTDKLIELGTGTSGTPAGDAGVVIERGSSDNAAILWDESRDEFVLCTTSATGGSSGDLTFDRANMSVARIGAGTEQAQAEGHFVRDVAASPVHSANAQVILEDDARPCLSLAGSAGNIGLIEFADNAASAAGMLYYDHGLDTFRVDCGGNADRLKVAANGDATIAGDIILDDGGSLKEAGGTAAVTFDGSGNVTKIGQGSPSSSDVLTWDGAKWAPSAAAGGASADDHNLLGMALLWS